MKVRFADLGVSPQMSHELSVAGFKEPFEVQMETIPDMMLGRDVCCRAPTGSGKTLAFGIPMIERVEKAEPHFPRALILTPTRELAQQIHEVLDPIAWGMDRKVMAVYGGVSYSKQIRRLERGVDIVVACPGRLLDLVEREDVVLEDVDIVIIDEADRMADMGFTDPVCDILEECSPQRQTIMFSATLDEDVAHIRDQYQYEPVTIEVGPKEVAVEEMEHHFWLMRNGMKSKIAAEAIRKSGRGFIFCRTRAGVDRVSEEMYEEGLRVASIHGGMQQNKRARAVEDFAAGRSHAIVATDVAARGLDIKGVHCVIHYDPPENGKAFKHRSGRTARAGESGNVISFVQNPQKRMWVKIQKEVGLDVQFQNPEFNELTQHEDISHIKPEKRKQRRGGRNQNRDNRRRGNSHNRGNRRDKRQGGGNRGQGGGNRGRGGGNRGQGRGNRRNGRSRDNSRSHNSNRSR